MDSKKSKLYSDAYKNIKSKGPYRFGPLSSEKLRVDPQYVMFQMSRYKHAARLLSKKNSILDIGPGDGIGLPILCSYFDNVTAVDIDQHMLDNSQNFLDDEYKCNFILNDFSMNPLPNKFDSAVAFDVLSLIPPEIEKYWFQNICKSLEKDGIFLVGTQNKNIQHLEIHSIMSISLTSKTLIN